jgi:hypothetical protein
MTEEEALQGSYIIDLDDKLAQLSQQIVDSIVK